MAFDGITISALVAEFNDKLLNARVQKIAQTEKDELIIHRLQISANPSVPLIYLRQTNKPSPATAPNFCMLLRKHINNAMLISIKQIQLDRVIRFEFEHYDDFGDLTTKNLVVEIMGKHSNIIFLDKDDIIIDSIKHINGLVSSVREVLPNKKYFIPNTNDKLDAFNVSNDDWNNIIFKKPTTIAKAIYTSISGISPMFAQELAFEAGLDGDASIQSITGNQHSSLMEAYRKLIERINNKDYSPQIYYQNNIPKDFSPFKLKIFEQLECQEEESMSTIIDMYYHTKDLVTRIRQKSSDLRKIVTTAIERSSKKMNIQQKQINDTQKKDKFKIYGELINTYGYQLSKEDKVLTCINYYDGKQISIPIDNTLSPTENANHYFEKYNKLKRTENALSIQIKENEEILEHLNSIMNELDIARNEEDLEIIRRELIEAGYIHKGGKKGKGKMPKSNPLHFISSDGYDIYVGKNNYQNDELTFKFATGNDWWFHAKNMPGSHVIIKSNNTEPPISTFEEAAGLAAFFSAGKESEKLEIDYIQKKHVKKPNGSKPGFVVYYTNYSIIAKKESIKRIKLTDEKDKMFLDL